jgi:hypothetical protein
MKTSVFSTGKIFMALLFAAVFFSVSKAKSYQLTFHENGDNLVVALDETPEGLFKEFYLIKLISPINKSIFQDGKYKITVKEKFIMLSGKTRTIVLTTDKSIIQRAFKQKIYFILVNGIASGEAPDFISAEEIMDAEILNKPFEQDSKEVDLEFSV